MVWHKRADMRTHHDPRQEMAEMSMKTDTGAAVVRSLIPARLDRLPWTRFHTRLIMALGTAWILDGLEITLAGAVAGVLTQSDTLHMSSAAVGAVATVYLVGEVVGALVFGQAVGQAGPAQAVRGDPGGLPDRQRADRGHGRRRARLGGVLVRHPVHRRDRDRRGVRRDQLRDR